MPIAGRIEPGVFERVDEPLFPPDALREGLANALCHRDYGDFGGSVSVALFDDRLEIASPGELPFGLTPEQLKKPHSSRPWNPLMANVFYRRGIIETWGRGTLKIMELLDKAGLPAPEFLNQTGSFVVTFRIPEEKQLTPQVTPQVTPHDAPQVEQLLEICIQPLSRQEMQDGLGLKDREHFRKYYLRPALDAGLIEQTIPQAPKSKFQKYRLTQAGRTYLQNMKKRRE
ncbi:MAG: ATP-binding protein [Desulfovermiculus sp.]|nr:ATP-binding protein [Desulfovermiculus sp.]